MNALLVPDNLSMGNATSSLYLDQFNNEKKRKIPQVFAFFDHTPQRILRKAMEEGLFTVAWTVQGENCSAVLIHEAPDLFLKFFLYS